MRVMAAWITLAILCPGIQAEMVTVTAGNFSFTFDAPTPNRIEQIYQNDAVLKTLDGSVEFIDAANATFGVDQSTIILDSTTKNIEGSGLSPLTITAFKGSMGTVISGFMQGCYVHSWLNLTQTNHIWETMTIKRVTV
jgi:hypothetical protein